MSEPRPPERPFRKNNRPNPNGGGMRVGRGLFGWVLFISLAIMLIMLLKNSNPQYQKIPFTDFETLMKQGRVDSFTIDGNDVEGQVKEGVVIPGAQQSNVQSL
jgi:cell division protease FtsH